MESPQSLAQGRLTCTCRQPLAQLPQSVFALLDLFLKEPVPEPEPVCVVCGSAFLPCIECGEPACSECDLLDRETFLLMEAPLCDCCQVG